MEAPATVTIAGKTYAVRIPAQFAVREELVVAYHSAADFSVRQRVCGAVLGVCCPDLAKASRTDYVRARFDVLGYGGAVYGWLREHDASMADVATAANPILEHLDSLLFPTEAEVVAEVNFSRPPVRATA